MLSKNFDSHRSLQQRFCIHVEDLNFFDISVYLSQRYYQPVLETFYQHKKVKLNRDVQYILISVPPCSHSSRLSYSNGTITSYTLSVYPFHCSPPTRIPSQIFAYQENVLVHYHHHLFLPPLFSSFPCLLIHNLQNARKKILLSR